MKSNSRDMHVILDEEMAKFLSKIGELEHIRQGARLCRNCGAPITLENIQFIIPTHSHSFEYVCNDPDCVQAYIDEGGQI